MFLRLVILVLIPFGLLCLAATDAAEPAAAGGGKEVKITVQEFDKVEVQQYPWGWIRWLMNSQIDPKSEMTFGVVFIKPNQSNPAHLHPNCEEVLHVLEGSCEHRLGDKWVKLKTGDTIRIPLGAHHAARTGDESCRAVIVYNTGDRQFEPVGEGKE
ncbi:MAG: cupin domain-containing protein [Planctomycetes bacterium]|nr:cupin domain-containing protein [Planctomycetota bacterium]